MSDTPSESDAVRENRHALYRKVETIENTVKEIHVALVGTALGDIGLVRRLSDLEVNIKTKAAQTDMVHISNKVEAHDRKLGFAMVVISGLWAFIVAFKERIFH